MTDAEKVKKLMDEKKINVLKLSKMTGISPTTLYSIFKRNGSISLENAIAIAEVFDINPNEICSNSSVSISKYTEERVSPIQRTLDLYEKNDPQMLYNAENILLAYFQMDDEAKEELLSFLEMKLKRHTDPEKLEQVEKTIKKKYKPEEYEECGYCRSTGKTESFGIDLIEECWDLGIFGGLEVAVSIEPRSKELMLSYFMKKGGYGDDTSILIKYCPICGRKLTGRYYLK